MHYCGGSCSTKEVQKSCKMDSVCFAGSEVQAWRGSLGRNGAGGAQRAELHSGETWAGMLQGCCRSRPPPTGTTRCPIAQTSVLPSPASPTVQPPGSDQTMP